MTVENPASSTLWTGPVGRTCMALGLLKTTLRPCMFGAAHPIHFALFHNFSEVRRLCLLRDGQHQHASWDQTSSLQLSACPLEMCQSLASAYCERLLESGCARGAAQVSLSRAAPVATCKQPQGNRIPPLVPPKEGFVVLRGPSRFMPPTGVLKKFTVLPPDHLVAPSQWSSLRFQVRQVCAVRGLGHRPWAHS